MSKSIKLKRNGYTELNNSMDNNNINDNNNIKFKKRNVLLPNIRYNKLNSQALKLLKDISKRKERNSIFLTNYDNNKTEISSNKDNKKKAIVRSYHKISKSIEDFNIFASEDNFIKELMGKFNIKNQPKIPRLEKRRQVLNKLYGIDPEFFKKMNRAKMNKNLSLEDYQINTFKVLTTNDIRRSELDDLAYNLKNLRIETESVSPLPPINVNIIVDHVRKGNNDDKKIKNLSIKEIINDTNEPRDEFEKEQRLIKKLTGYKVMPKRGRNRAFDALPDYLKEALARRFKHNS